MVDVTLAVGLTRSLLGLGDLAINDHVNYAVSGGEDFTMAFQWRREQVDSPYLDGAWTASRTKQQFNYPLAVEIFAEDQASMATCLQDILRALRQDNFNIVYTIGGVTTTWAAEAADISLVRTGPRLAAIQYLLQSQILVQPNPITGVV